MEWHEHLPDGTVDVSHWPCPPEGAATPEERQTRRLAVARAHRRCGCRRFWLLERAAEYVHRSPATERAAEAWRHAQKVRRRVHLSKTAVDKALLAVEWAELVRLMPERERWDDSDEEAFAALARTKLLLIASKVLAYAASEQAAIFSEWAREHHRLAQYIIEDRPRGSGIAGLVRVAFRLWDATRGSRNWQQLARMKPVAWVDFAVASGVVPVPRDRRESRSFASSVSNAIDRIGDVKKCWQWPKLRRKPLVPPVQDAPSPKITLRFETTSSPGVGAPVRIEGDGVAVRMREAPAASPRRRAAPGPSSESPSEVAGSTLRSRAKRVSRLRSQAWRYQLPIILPIPGMSNKEP